jgi:ATP-dependent RNA helicase RhlE
LQGFKNRTIKVLVATDIASRGIDVDKLSHVINFELPEVPETYVHRIGRTGRAGESGTAISFCSSEERGSLKDINKLLPQNIEIKRMNGFLASSHVAIESAIADSPKRSSRQSRPSRPSRPSSSTSRTSSTSSTSSSGARPFQRKRW